jgi:hypothetical protein
VRPGPTDSEIDPVTGMHVTHIQRTSTRERDPVMAFHDRNQDRNQDHGRDRDRRHNPDRNRDRDGRRRFRY